MDSKCQVKYVNANISYRILYNLIDNVIVLIILIMFAEWFFTYYIITTQHGRDVGEITFDHNHENLSDPIQKGQISFRRKELMYWKVFKIFTFIYFCNDILQFTLNV